MKFDLKALKIKIKSKRLILIVILSLTAFGFILFSGHGLLFRFRIEAERKEYLNKINEESRVRDSLNRKIIQLKADTLEIERIAREHYGMVKPGEKVFIIKKNN